MRVLFVSRHKGAKEWAVANIRGELELVEHLTPGDIEKLDPDDQVVGNLPVNIAAQVNSRGARYFHLTLDVPFELRGRELSSIELSACGVVLEEYYVRKA